MKKIKASVLLERIQHEIDAVLQEQFSRSLFRVSKLDQCRLVRLKVWEERYSISLNYILSALLPWSWSRLPKHIREKSKTSRGLGTRIAVLTSHSAEAHLKEKISEDFPDGEHLAFARHDRRDEIIKQLTEDGLATKAKKVLDYKTVSAFVHSYSDKIQRKKKMLGKINKRLAKMPWRGNPFV